MIFSLPNALRRMRGARRWAVWIIGPAVLLTALSLLLPPPGAVTRPTVNDPVRITDRNGALLYELRDAESGNRDHLELTDIPQTFVDAVVATEDRRFWTHPGIDPAGLFRALWQNLSSGRIVSGASTITQQLVRIRMETADRSVFQKLLEMHRALRTEISMSKEEILEGYLNSAYFGHQAYGIEAAAHAYFGKNASELSLAEQTLLAGLPQSPSAFDPFRSMEKAKRRQRTVLDSLVATGKLTEEQATEIFHEPLTLGEDRIDINAPHFVFWLQQTRDADLQPGSTVRTTLDLPLQQETERIVTAQLKNLAEKNVTSAAVVVLDAHTGDVLAMVGSADYFDDEHDGSVNVATSLRQPGSTLKPFTYALALTGGDTLASTVTDIEERYFTEDGNPYTPRNYDYQEHGLVRYREALANSYNIAAVKVLERVGVERLMQLLAAAGIRSLTQSPEHYGLALTLGDAEVRLLELTQAYAVFARGGRTLPLRSLLSDPIRPGQSVLDERTAWLIADTLSDNEARTAEFGLNSPLHLPFPAAAKTGTTRNSRDNWTIGFTGDRIVGVWVGNADNAPMREISGVTGAAPIFHDVMIAAMQNLPKEGIAMPSGIIQREICRLSGKLPGDVCPEKTREYFIAGTEPTASDDLWKRIRIDTRNNLIAGDGCPDAFVTERTIAIFPPALRPWAAAHGWPEPPRGTSPLCGTPNDDPLLKEETFVQIDWPHDGDSFELDPLVPDERESITFRAHTSLGITGIGWFVNGQKIGEGLAPDFAIRWNPVPGQHSLEARAGESTHRIRITVRKKGEGTDAP